MKIILFAVALLGVLFSIGCGSGPGIHGIVGGTGNFSNASLNGSYVYQMNGVDFTTSGSNVLYHEAGVFTADGNGHITSGIDDFTEGTNSSLGNTLTGTYSVSSDGTGTVTLNAGSSTLTWALSMASSSKVYLVEEDAVNAAGVAELQSTSATASAPTGTFVFKMHTASAQGSTATAGQVSLSTGNFQSGSVDVNRAGTFSSPTLTNFLLNAPISNGRGTGTFSTSLGTVSAFMYYIVDGNNIRMLSTDTSSGIGGFGRAEAQSGGPFTAASVNGNYVFTSKGDDGSGIGSVDTVGLIQAAAGSITGGSYDAVQDGTPLSNVAITSGTYQIAANGRATVTLVSASKTVTQVFWMVSPARAFVVTSTDTSDPSDVEDGVASLQQTSAFTNASVKGTFGFFMDGFNGNLGLFIDRIGTLQWDGSGKLSLNEFVNDSGTGSAPGILTGTYAVSANGRATGNVSTLSINPNDLVFYFVSNNQAYVLQEDSTVQLNGEMSH